MTSKNGLTAAEVEQSRARHGINVITPPKKESVWKLFFDKFRDPIIRILLIAAALSLVVGIFDGEYMETVGICVAILLATGVAFWFEYDAKKRFEALSAVSDDIAVKVVRDGRVDEIARRDVVVGDLVVIESGEEVPADGRLTEAVSLGVNESTLTGEPLTRKTTDPAHFDSEATYPSDYVLRGTTVSEGHGMFVVDAVGDATEYGKVAQGSMAPKTEKTPLEKQLDRLSKLIGKYGMWISVAVFVIMVAKGLLTGAFAGGDWLQVFRLLLGYFMVAVVLMVMAVPEGLPMSITLSLAMSMRRMIKTNNLVRKMHACETMGAVTVICTDKTGTLTQNKMTVSQMVEYVQSPGLLEEACAVNSTAFLDGQGKAIGNPTEGALLMWLDGRGADYVKLRGAARIVDQMTFTTERKYMATIAVSAVTGRKMLYVKGAPEIVGRMAYDGGLPAEVTGRLKEFQGMAMRTLGFAWKETDSDKCDEAISGGGLTFAAVAAISDPVREDVPAAVNACRNAGIAIKIVTGDTPDTAREIARRIGLWNDAEDGDRNRMTGSEFAAMSDEELLERVGDLKIMARARPLDKERLVKLLQQRGEVVAVTGDGTNDAPALNAADVGLSMGSGTSVAMQASDITLLDDSFATIATAVMWGRSLYKNIQRFVLFQLTVNLTALVVVFFGSIFGSEAPLTVTQILWVNIIMDTFAAMALASLPPNPAVMGERPRAQGDFIISRPMMKVIGCTGALFVAVLLGMLFYCRGLAGAEHERFMSLFFTTFVFLQFWNLFNARIYGVNDLSQTGFRQSKGFLLILLLIAFGQFMIVTFGGEVFRTVPLTWQQWAVAAGATSLVALLGFATRKAFR